MNRTRLVFIGILALALGALASWSSFRVLQAHNGPRQGGTDDVVVAATNISLGSRIQDRDIRVVHLPAEAIPQGSYRKIDARLVGRGVIQSIAAGDFVLSTKLAPENAGAGLPSMIPPGMRAFSVRVNDFSSVSGFVQPGSRVDVLMTASATGSNEPQTITVLRNVAVLANGQKLDRSVLSNESQNSPVITLAVSPDDAARLALAMNQGHIQLALRNPLDTNQTEVAAVGMRSLYQKGGPPVTPVHTKPKPAPTPVAQAPAPTEYGVEVIKGNKRDVTKLPD
jgi:pilus assembly protein CpaB